MYLLDDAMEMKNIAITYFTSENYMWQNIIFMRTAFLGIVIISVHFHLVKVGNK